MHSQTYLVLQWITNTENTGKVIMAMLKVIIAMLWSVSNTMRLSIHFWVNKMHVNVWHL